MAGEERFAVLRKRLEKQGWRLDRISGSHHIFRRRAIRPLSFLSIVEK